LGCRVVREEEDEEEGGEEEECVTARRSKIQDENQQFIISTRPRMSSDNTEFR
jgi:hypothetical protein